MDHADERLLAKRLSLAQVDCALRSLQNQAVPAGGTVLDGAGRPLALLRVERGRLRCGGLELHAGDSLLAAAGSRVECRTPALVSILRLRLELAGAVDALAGLRLPVRLPPDREGLSAAAWDELLASWRRLRAGDAWMRVRCRALILALTGLLLRSGCAAGTVALDQRGQAAWLRAALEAARRRLGDQRLRVADLAAAAHLSPSHFTHRFSAAMGQPPLRWLLAERVRRACALLGDRPELGVKGIARACGFGDPCHFSRQFRRLAGCPPSAWNRLHPPSPTDPLPGGVHPP